MQRLHSAILCYRPLTTNHLFFSPFDAERHLDRQIPSPATAPRLKWLMVAPIASNTGPASILWKCEAPRSTFLRAEPPFQP